MEWTDAARNLLNELLCPIPVLDRSQIKKRMKAQIEELATEQEAQQVEQEHIVHFYLCSTPDPYQRKAVRHLQLRGLASSSPPAITRETRDRASMR